MILPLIALKSAKHLLIDGLMISILSFFNSSKTLLI